MSEAKIRQILIHRSGSDTPINLYDKSTADDETLTNMLSNVFSSPKISVVSTSSGIIILKPSKIDAIEIIDNIEIPEDALELNEIKNENSFVDVTQEIEFDEEIEIDVDRIVIDNITVNNGTPVIEEDIV